MNGFLFLTDSCSGMSEEFYREHNIEVLQLGLSFGEDVYDGTDGKKQTDEEFYARLRKDKNCHTFQATSEQAREKIENIFKQGKDVLILSFSSALSGTASSFSVAASAATEAYPSRKALVLDSLGGSLGQGLILYYLVKKAESGADLEETYRYGEELRHRIHHLFTVDDLEYLKRGGRISSTAVLVGKLLKIKPILHATPSGSLAPIAKIIGRKRSIEALAAEVEKLAELEEDDPIFISHADCIEDAEKLAELIKTRLGRERKIVIRYIDHVMGVHCGPGTVAVFFKGKPKKQK